MLSKRKLVNGLPNLVGEKSLCEACIIGKHHRDKFPKASSWRATKPLMLVYADICGPMQTPSLSGSKYFLLFIDDFSRKTWVYFLKEKSEAFGCFKRFRAMVEKESNCSILKLRTDRGGEFLSTEFEAFCSSLGIQRQYTARYTPQQNGVIERKTRTIVEAARSMLNQKSLPKKFWAEAVGVAVYLLNRFPTQALGDLTPYEAWHGRKPNVSHLKTFGCIGYAFVPAELRRKLDEKSQKCIFVGYSKETKGYRLFDPISENLVISRDVIFNEQDAWNWDDVPQPKYMLDVGDMEPTTSLEVPTTESPPDSPPRSLAEIYESCQYASLASEPGCFEEAINNEEWCVAMEAEIKAIERNHTWSLVELPEGKEAIGLKWVYRSKFHPDGSLQKHKARLVAKGYAQVAGIDFTETYAPVAHFDTIRTLLAVAANNRWEVFQLDVKSAFLNGDLLEDVFVEQPQGFILKGEEHKVYKLHKALYGLRQAPRAWYSKIDSYFVENGFRRSRDEHTLYVKSEGD